MGVEKEQGGLRRLKTRGTRLAGSVCYQYWKIYLSSKVWGWGMPPVRVLLPAGSSWWADGPLPARPLCRLPGMCWALVEAAMQIASTLWPLATPSSPLIPVRRCLWPTRSQQITGQGGARAVFGGCPAFGGHMACSPQMGSRLRIKRFGSISWNRLLAAHFQSLEQWRSDRLPRQRTAFSERFAAASSLVNWWSRVYLGLWKKSCCPAFYCGESFCLRSNKWN